MRCREDRDKGVFVFSDGFELQIDKIEAMTDLQASAIMPSDEHMKAFFMMDGHGALEHYKDFVWHRAKVKMLKGEQRDT